MNTNLEATYDDVKATVKHNFLSIVHQSRESALSFISAYLDTEKIPYRRYKYEIEIKFCENRSTLIRVQKIKSSKLIREGYVAYFFNIRNGIRSS